jgi:hypothetical protein
MQDRPNIARYGIFSKTGIEFPLLKMTVGPSKDWPGTMMLFWKVLGSLFVTLPLYWVMVTAFHLLNLPSDRAVLGGVCLLLVTAAGGFVAFRKIWRM